MLKTLAASAAAIVLVGGALRSEAQNCTVNREKVLAELEAGASVDELQKKYEGCVAEDTAAVPASNLATAAGPVFQPVPIPTLPPPVPILFPSESIKNTGSTFWEAIKSCGYNPQREEANCAFEVRQRFGYGGPVGAPGSHEYFLFCADLGAGLVPIHTNGVHLNDESFGVQPRWSFSATIQSDPRLLSLRNNGQTMRHGRVILAWLFPPANCNAAPIWGNQSDFRFRLDP
jgi:hypothetical protein